MTAPERNALLGEVRALTQRYQAGGRDAFEAFRALVDRLLRVTILAPHGGVRLASGPRGPDMLVLGGWAGPDDPLPLNDGRYLRLSITLYREAVEGDARLKVYEAGCQYQMDREGERWVFRYDYLRHPPDPHPGAHVQIRGALTEDCLLPGDRLERVHFPTSRVSLEAVIRLLAVEFAVPCHMEPAVWQPVLAESERAFLRIAHLPVPEP